MSIGDGSSSFCRQLDLSALAIAVLEDRFSMVRDVGLARAREPERLVELDRLLEVADVHAVLPDPGEARRRRVVPRMTLDQLDEVTVGVTKERDSDRPAVHTRGRRFRLVARFGRRAVLRIDVVRVDVQLPERVPVIDRPRLLLLLASCSFPPLSPSFSMMASKAFGISVRLVFVSPSVS